MEEQNETPKAPAARPVSADQDTLARSRYEDEMLEKLDEKVADTLLDSDMEVAVSGEEAAEEPIDPEIVQQTIDA